MVCCAPLAHTIVLNQSPRAACRYPKVMPAAKGTLQMMPAEKEVDQDMFGWADDA